MTERRGGQVGRRDVFRVMTGSVAIVVMGRLNEVEALPPNAAGKRKARYNANAPEVQSFYRVNRYPPQ